MLDSTAPELRSAELGMGWQRSLQRMCVKAGDFEAQGTHKVATVVAAVPKVLQTVAEALVDTVVLIEGHIVPAHARHGVLSLLVVRTLCASYDSRQVQVIMVWMPDVAHMGHVI